MASLNSRHHYTLYMCVPEMSSCHLLCLLLAVQSCPWLLACNQYTEYCDTMEEDVRDNMEKDVMDDMEDSMEDTRDTIIEDTRDAEETVIFLDHNIWKKRRAERGTRNDRRDLADKVFFTA